MKNRPGPPCWSAVRSKNRSHAQGQASPQRDSRTSRQRCLARLAEGLGGLYRRLHQIQRFQCDSSESCSTNFNVIRNRIG